MNDNCIFCKIAAGQIPSATVYEDDDFRAILDIAPAHKGHTIILPKKHADNIFSLDDEVTAKVFPAVTASTSCRTTERLQASLYSICTCMSCRVTRATAFFRFGRREATKTAKPLC